MGWLHYTSILAKRNALLGGDTDARRVVRATGGQAVRGGARALTALAATDTHIALITTSEVDISLLVSESSLETALNALTQAFAVTTA